MSKSWSRSQVPPQSDLNYGTATGSAFGGSHNHNELTNINTTNNYLGGTDEFKQLASRCAHNATHDSVFVSSQGTCHPGTREAILGRLTRWATQGIPQTKEESIIWIYGPAGTGKSAIERTLAVILQQMGRLVASFFFFRTDQGRNSAARFVPTIAYQLATNIPLARPLIEKAIHRDPNIFEKSLEAQAESLIIGPMSSLGEDVQFTQRIVIVDGLDECAPSEQELVVKVLLKLARKTSFAVVIASRPEPAIQAVFRQEALRAVTLPLPLDESLEPDKDIRKYLTDVFQSIRHSHPLKSYLPMPDWPPEGAVNHLVSKASGQFIYASTVEKFISSPKHKPHERLDIILGIQAAGFNRPYGALDDLYSAIFNSVEKVTLKHALRIIGVLLSPYPRRIPITKLDCYTVFKAEAITTSTQCPAFLELLLHLKLGDVRSSLLDLQSLISIAEHDDDVPISFYHASLPDYLLDRSRSGVFYINVRQSHFNVLLHCARHVLTPKPSQSSASSLNWLHVQHLLDIADMSELDVPIEGWRGRLRRYRRAIFLGAKEHFRLEYTEFYSEAEDRQ